MTRREAQPPMQKIRLLGRALRDVEEGEIETALARYENVRKQRTGRVQIGSRGNE